MNQYGRVEYWEERYTREPEPFDWLQRYSALREYITPLLEPNSAVLQVGAGNSKLSEEMYEEGFTNITNIDISETVTKLMQDKCRDKKINLKYQTMDVRKMDFDDCSFDMVIDKATFDSVICGEGSTKNIEKMMDEVYRVLKDDGVYLMVSYVCSEQRLPSLQRTGLQWDVKVEKINKPTMTTSITIQADDKDVPNLHFIYICNKNKTNKQL